MYVCSNSTQIRCKQIFAVFGNKNFVDNYLDIKYFFYRPLHVGKKKVILHTGVLILCSNRMI